VNEQLKELIAVGASVAANCQPCIRYHIGKAREHGVDSADIKEAIKVGQTVRAGAAANMDSLIQELDSETKSAFSACKPDMSNKCCC
jgi:AhpD family alkylhydroperoxidase